MSLQGSLDTFALPDVLVLLAGAAKTGELRVTGLHSAAIGTDEVTACVRLEGGRLAGHDHPASPTITDAVLALLRMRRGTFEFTPGPVTAAAETYELGPVLDEARARLAEWAEIEEVVPSSSAQLRLVAGPGRDLISLTLDQWRLVVAIGSGRSVSGAIADLGVGELAGHRAVKDLVVDGLVTVEAFLVTAIDTSADPSADASGEAGEAVSPAVSPQLAWATPVSSWGASTLATPPLTAWTEPPLEEAYGVLRVVPDISADPSEPEPPSAPDWRAEMADIHDLDSLVSRSPVAAPLGLDDDALAAEDTVMAPLAQGGDDSTPLEEDEPLNRGLLLKFLSSVRN